MPEIIETTLYRLNELSDAAKDKARAWYREGGFDYDWYDASMRISSVSRTSSASTARPAPSP